MGCLCLDTASVVRSSVAERIVIIQTPPEVIGLNELVCGYGIDPTVLVL